MPDSDSIHILTDRVTRVACHKCGQRIDVSHMAPFKRIECPGCHVQTPVPAQLGSFLLFKELGKGAMGAVYQAFDKTLKRHVAIKVMHRSLGENRQFVEKFLDEARALAALNEPSVVQIYTCGEEKGQPYIVMELVPGGRLDKVMEETESSDEAQVLQWAIDIATGLKAAHDIGLTHGDIKPENILFTRDQTAKVVDFGLARFAGSHAQAEEVWGTPFYISPEQARGEPGHHQADIYSLGATLFHVLAHEPPFDKPTAQETVLARLRETAPRIRSLRPDLHPETDDIIARMLEREPSARYPTYSSLLSDLHTALGAAQTGPYESGESGTKKRRMSRPLLFGIGLVVLVSLAWWWWSHPRKATTPEPASVSARATAGVRSQPGTTRERPPRPTTTTPSKPKNRVPPGTPLTPSNADLAIPSSADAFVQGKSGSRYGGQDILWVKSASEDSVHLSRKVYLRFDLASLGDQAVVDARLILTAVPAGKNRLSADYILMLWGITSSAPTAEWSESAGPDGLNWDNAPANTLESGDQLGKGALRLVQRYVPDNITPGKKLHLSNAEAVAPNLLVDFVNDAAGGTVTFAVTAGSEVPQKAGWKFASRENKDFDPPTLLLRYK